MYLREMVVLRLRHLLNLEVIVGTASSITFETAVACLTWFRTMNAQGMLRNLTPDKKTVSYVSLRNGESPRRLYLAQTLTM